MYNEVNQNDLLFIYFLLLEVEVRKMINSISDFRENDIPDINLENISRDDKVLVITGLLKEYQNEYNNAIGYEKVYYFQIIKALNSVLDDLKQKVIVKAKNTLY